MSALTPEILDAVCVFTESVAPNYIIEVITKLELADGYKGLDRYGKDDHLPQGVRILLKKVMIATSAPGISLPAKDLALAMRCAMHMAMSFRDRHRLDLAWTGPESSAISIRRTEQLILEIIERTQKELLVVTYAVHRPEKIRKALIQAVGRGVQIRLVVDGQATENHETSKKWNNILSLGRELRDNCEIYVWPEEHRPRTRGGEPSKLHVKCIVADRKCLLVSSANLTVNAMNLNMELGLSITGFEAADRIARHFEALMANGDLIRVEGLDV